MSLSEMRPQLLKPVIGIEERTGHHDGVPTTLAHGSSFMRPNHTSDSMLRCWTTVVLDLNCSIDECGGMLDICHDRATLITGSFDIA